MSDVREFANAVATIHSKYPDREGEYATIIVYGKHITICEGDDEEVWIDFTGLTEKPRMVISTGFRYGKPVEKYEPKPEWGKEG